MRAADALLQYQGTSLEVFLLDAREPDEQGKRRNFPRIAEELRHRTDGIIDVSHETVRRWHAFYESREQAGAA
jgi:hypothetical protein